MDAAREIPWAWTLTLLHYTERRTKHRSPDALARVPLSVASPLRLRLLIPG